MASHRQLRCFFDGRPVGACSHPVGQRKSTEGLLARDAILCFAGARGERPGMSPKAKSPEEEGLLLASNSLEIAQNLFSQEFDQWQMSVSDKKMSIHLKQRIL